jgi:hypothetical protein
MLDISEIGVAFEQKQLLLFNYDLREKAKTVISARRNPGLGRNDRFGPS